MKRTTILPLILSLPTLTLACTAELDPDPTDTQLRAAVFAQTWALDGEHRYEGVNCEELAAEEWAELSPGQRAIAEARTVCEPVISGEGEVLGAVVRDGFGVRVDWTGAPLDEVRGQLYDLAWSGYSVGDEAPSQAPAEASAAQLCETMQGVKPSVCLAMAHAAELARDRADELLAAFPAGGVGTLTEHDGVLLVSGFVGASGDDLLTSTAEALDWRLPALDGEFVLGEANGESTPGGCTITVTPNGTTIISTKRATITPQPLPKPPSLTTHHFAYSMSSPGANYNMASSHVVGGWSRYAAIWKSLADAQVGQVDIIASYVGSNHDPLLGAEAALEYHESVYFKDIWGSVYDPRGTWYSVDIDDPMTGLVYAAIAMHYWGTPVFVSGEWTPPSSVAPTGAWYGDISIEQLSFSSQQYTSLHDACGIGLNDSAATALTAVTNSGCNLGGLSLTGGVASAWLGDFSPVNSPALLHHQSISGPDLLGAYAAGYTWSPGFPSGRVGELVLDPPEAASEEEIAAVLGLAEAIASEL